jgi:SAM-dependent methyltransferase
LTGNACLGKAHGMSRVSGHLRLYIDGEGDSDPAPGPVRRSVADAAAIANRELIRPPSYRRGHHIDPFSSAWFDDLEHKRFSRHGGWLSAALEFGRHPGESVLMIHPGLGSDAIRYLQSGTEVTLAVSEEDSASLVRANLDRLGLRAPIATMPGSSLPFADGIFDVVVVNGLFAALDLPVLTEELFRLLKCGGKVIGLFPARYDAGFWQDLLLPYQQLYWRRPPDPTSAPKTTAGELRRAFTRFAEYKFFKRHLRRSELPHLCRVLPLTLLERLLGRVLVLKAKKPISAARIFLTAVSDSLAA